MSAIDLYDETFPHSTKEGYTKGCRGAGCPGGIEHGMTCTQVWRRYSSDYQFAKKIDSGLSVGDILFAEKEADASEPAESMVDAVQAHGLVGKDADGELCSCGARAESLVEHFGVVALGASGERVAPPTPVVLAKPAPGGFPHGTTAGYAKGCHDGTQCEGHPDTGMTCREAYQKYQREYAARRRANGGPLKTAPKAPKAQEAPKPVAPKPTPPAYTAPETAPTPVVDTTELDAARAEIQALRDENAALREQIEKLEAQSREVAPTPQEGAQRAEVTFGEGLSFTVSVTVGRAA